jgi:hypothetical protein
VPALQEKGGPDMSEERIIHGVKIKGRGPWFETFSHIKYHLYDPSPTEVTIKDIAHHLSLINRFGGAFPVAYSVAAHSIIVSRLYKKDPFQGLMHDAAEAYFGDVVQPFKVTLDVVKLVEHDNLKVISRKYGFQYPFNTELKQYDKAMTYFEATWAGMRTDEWTDPQYVDNFLSVEETAHAFNYIQRFIQMPAKVVENEFLREFDKYRT